MYVDLQILESVEPDHQSRNVEIRQLADGCRVVRTSDQDHEIGLAKDDRLHRRSDGIPNARYREDFHRMVIETRATRDPGAFAKLEQDLGSDRYERDDASRRFGQDDHPARVIDQTQRLLLGRSPADGG
jgi:hypothetical protein